MLLSCVTIAGCSPDTESGDEGTIASSAAQTQIHGREIESLQRIRFLQLSDGDVAGAWLAIKAQALDDLTPPPEATIVEYAAMLRELAARLPEDRRMIANRTVQTRDVLEERGIPTSIRTIITGLLDVARAGVVGSYGSYCDYYINLRLRRLTHADALAEMRALRALPASEAP